MSDDLPPPAPSAPTLNYARPGTSPDRSRVLWGVIAGLAAAGGVVMACAMGGAFIDSTVNRGKELAGLGGLFVGAIVGGVLVLTGGIGFVIRARKGDRPMVRGVGIGLLLALGLGGLVLGICAIALH